jgi:UDP-glucose 4-epimerase
VSISGARILVTGGAGFIGSHLVDLLTLEGANVVVFDDLSAGRLDNIAGSAGHIEFVQGSVTDADLVSKLTQGCRFVFNFAANADVPYSVRYPQVDFLTNALGAFNVYQACLKHNVERVLQASTAAVYGEPVYTPMDENHPLRPISPYGASKLSAEAMGLAWHSCFGLPFTAIRIFNTYGPRQPRYVIYDLFRKIQNDPGHLEVLGNGMQVRDYCYVTDTAKAFLQLAESTDAVGQVFNIAGGNPIAISELVGLILETLGLRGTTVTYTGSSWPGDITRLIADLEKIRRQGFSPTIDLREGLQRFASWINP